MPDINQMITLGIGTPADIEHLILFGLNANPQGAIDLCDATAVSLMPERTAVSLETDRTAVSLMPRRTAEPYCEP